MGAVLVLCAPCVGLAAGSAPARHQPSLADKETARELFRTGDDKFVAGDYPGALEAFEAADAIMRVPTTGLERGRTLAKLGRLLEARDVLLRVGRMAPEPGESKAFARARLEAKSLGERVVRRIPAVLVRIEGLEAGEEAELRIDGAPVPPEAARFPRRVDPGKHTVTVQAAGYAPVRRLVEVVEAETSKVTIDMLPQDDTGAGDALAALSWIGFGVGAAGVVAGSVAGGITLARVSDLDERCVNQVCGAADQDAVDAALLSSHISTAGFIVAGVGVAVGVVALLLQGGDAPAEGTAALWAQPGESRGVVLRF